MLTRLRRKAKQILEPRYEDLEDLYLRHREAAERLVRDPDRFMPINADLTGVDERCHPAGDPARQVTDGLKPAIFE